MFFICGINPVRKAINYERLIICSKCGNYGRYEVYMTYMCFSIFFIPIIKWDKHYYIETTCCSTLYELDKNIGDKIKNGGNIEITEKDLTIISYENNNGWGFSNNMYDKKCVNCGYVGAEDFEYCPKCGRKL